MPDDEHWMRLAITQAEKGIGLTAPNPSVGAVIVRDGVVLGKGYHIRAGQPHAEREAIAAAGKNHPDDNLTGSTIYITLEPCSTAGRTPACTEGILQTGITRVVYGASDPNPAHAGRGADILRAAGIEVVTGVLESDCTHLIRAFSKRIRTGLPWVILKSAMSLDGRITRPPSEGQWLTSPASRAIVQKMRHANDAILTGGQTLRLDDPKLTLRDPSLPPKAQPWRMILTQGKKASLPLQSNVFTDAHADRTLVQEDGDILAALKTLGDLGCNSVLVEAGGTLMAAFLDAGHADEIAVFYAPMLNGGPDAAFAKTFAGRNLTSVHLTQIDSDLLVTGLLSPPAAE